jgi:nucleoside-diphosphate-sugar epimerase
MKPKVLLTGASGFIGRPMLSQLTDRFEVHAVTRVAEVSDTSDVEWHVSDLMSPGSRRALMNTVRPSHLVHLAWVTEHGRYWSSPANLDWVATSLMMLRDFEEHGGQRALMIGTCAEYDWTRSGPYSERSPTDPNTLYGTCKLATWMVSRLFATQSSISLGWARLFHLYGPGEHRDRLVPFLIRAALDGEAAVPRTPDNIVDLMYVDDAASALVRLLTSDVEGAVNVCTGEPISIRELAGQISRLAGIEPAEMDAPGGNEIIVGDPTRLRSEVGYTDERTLAEGLQATMEWWRNQPGPR